MISLRSLAVWILLPLLLLSCSSKQRKAYPLGHTLSLIRSQDVAVTHLDGVRIDPANKGILIAPGLKILKVRLLEDSALAGPPAEKELLLRAESGATYLLAPGGDRSRICAWLISKHAENRSRPQSGQDLIGGTAIACSE